MPSDGAQLLAGYRQLDAALVDAGRHATSPAWMSTLERFWLSGRRRLVVRKGRQAGGSTTLARVAVATALFGEHRAPPGTRLTVPFVSIKVSEAAERLRNIADALDVLGEPLRDTKDAIELPNRGVTFATFACSYRRSVGMTSIAAFEDEVPRWWSDEAMANPAAEVDAAIAPSLATQPNARIYSIGSPMGLDDFHAELFAKGETDHQCIAEGPSWFWNPAISEAETRGLVTDERKWLREFAAIPQAGALSAFDADAVAAAFERADVVKNATARGEPVLVIDASSGKKDSWSWAICRWVRPAGSERPFIVFDSVDGVDGAFWKQVSGDQIVARLAGVAKAKGARRVLGDQREEFLLRPALEKHGLRLYVHPWTATSKPQAVERVRRWLADGTVILPPHERLRRELLAFEERLTSSGGFTFGARGNGHDDYASLLVTAAMGDAAGNIPRARDLEDEAELERILERGFTPYAGFFSKGGI